MQKYKGIDKKGARGAKPQFLRFILLLYSVILYEIPIQPTQIDLLACV